jgi:hypothetical protein
MLVWWKKLGKSIGRGQKRDGLGNVLRDPGQTDQQMREAPCGERLRQFSDVDDARFFLLADAKMDTISRFEAIDQGWIRHAEGHFHWSHEIAGRSDRLVIQQDQPLICHNAEHRPFAFVWTPLSRLESGDSEYRP